MMGTKNSLKKVNAQKCPKMPQKLKTAKTPHKTNCKTAQFVRGRLNKNKDTININEKRTKIKDTKTSVI